MASGWRAKWMYCNFLIQNPSVLSFTSVQVEELVKKQMDAKHFGKQTEKCTTFQNTHKIRPYQWWNSSTPHSKSWLNIHGKTREWRGSTLLRKTGSPSPFGFPQPKAASLEFSGITYPFSEKQKGKTNNTWLPQNTQLWPPLLLQYHACHVKLSCTEAARSTSGSGSRSEEMSTPGGQNQCFSNVKQANIVLTRQSNWEPKYFEEPGM